MAIPVITEFVRKGTVRIIVYVYDDDEALVDATAVIVSVVNPAGTAVVDEQAMAKTATGTYEYYYTTTTAVIEGDYRIQAQITDGSYESMVHGHFNMKAGVNE